MDYRFDATKVLLSKDSSGIWVGWGAEGIFNFYKDIIHSQQVFLSQYICLQNWGCEEIIQTEFLNALYIIV